MKLANSALLLLALLFAKPVCAEAKAPMPLVMLMERNPWLHVVGSDSPSFVLYEDGLTIFMRTEQNGKSELASVLLDPTEIKEWLASFLDPKPFDDVKEYYRLVYMTDQPTNFLAIWSQGQIKKVYIYGSLRRRAEENRGADTLPPKLAALIDKILKFKHLRAQPWHPDKVEFMAQPNPGDPKKAIPWPVDLPDINHPTTLKRGDLYSIYVDYNRFQALSKKVKEKGTPFFLINGKTWTADYRYPFPGEAHWMRH